MAPSHSVFSFACPICGGDISSRTELAGKEMMCPKCQEIVTVPGPESVIEDGAATATETLLDAASKIEKGLGKGVSEFQKKSGGAEYGCGLIILIALIILVVYFLGC